MKVKSEEEHMTHPIFPEAFSEEKFIEAKTRAYNKIMADLKAWAEAGKPIDEESAKALAEWIAQSN